MESGLKLLPGQRFCPMEDELLMFYLKPKVNGMQVPGEGEVIFEFDLYGDQDPWKIWKKFEARRANDLRRNKDLYFFTQKKKKTAKGSRASRTVGNGGTWKGQNKGTKVCLLDQNHQQPSSTLLGLKKTYTYKNKGSIHDGGWIMYEFTLDESQIHHKEQVNKNDYVLCLLRKNDVLSEKKIKKQEEDQILEDYVEDDDADNTDLESVTEEPERKRQQLLTRTDYVPSPSLEAVQEYVIEYGQEAVLSPAPLEYEAEMGMDENMAGLLEPPMLDEAELKQLFDDEFLQACTMEVGDWDAADLDSYNLAF